MPYGFYKCMSCERSRIIILISIISERYVSVIQSTVYVVTCTCIQCNTHLSSMYLNTSSCWYVFNIPCSFGRIHSSCASFLPGLQACLLFYFFRSPLEGCGRWFIEHVQLVSVYQHRAGCHKCVGTVGQKPIRNEVGLTDMGLSQLCQKNFFFLLLRKSSSPSKSVLCRGPVL